VATEVSVCCGAAVMGPVLVILKVTEPAVPPVTWAVTDTVSVQMSWGSRSHPRKECSPLPDGGVAASLVELIVSCIVELAQLWPFTAHAPALQTPTVPVVPHEQLAPLVCGVHVLSTQVPPVGSNVCPCGHDGGIHDPAAQHWLLLSV
jgi:hypothetical protein